MKYRLILVSDISHILGHSDTEKPPTFAPYGIERTSVKVEPCALYTHYGHTCC